MARLKVQLHMLTRHSLIKAADLSSTKVDHQLDLHMDHNRICHPMDHLLISNNKVDQEDHGQDHRVQSLLGHSHFQIKVFSLN